MLKYVYVYLKNFWIIYYVHTEARVYSDLSFSSDWNKYYSIPKVLVWTSISSAIIIVVVFNIVIFKCSKGKVWSENSFRSLQGNKVFATRTADLIWNLPADSCGESFYSNP